jgi:Cd2+/Zn2+-exporting ATPase
MFSPLIAIYRNPADRRKWLTIAAALVAFYGFGQATPLGAADDGCRDPGWL